MAVAKTPGHGPLAGVRVVELAGIGPGPFAAMHHARATGTGQVVDAAVVDGTSHLSAMIHGMLAAGGRQDRRAADLLDGGCPFYGTYETADGTYETTDGRYVAVGALEQRLYGEFVDLLGIGDRAPARKDVAAWGELRETVAARFRTRTRDEWTAVFEGSDACVAPVLSLREAPLHTHLAARGTFTDFGGISQPAPAPRFSAPQTSVLSGPAQPGADTADVAHDWGISGLLKDAPVHDASGKDGPSTDGSSTGGSLRDASAKDTD